LFDAVTGERVRAFSGFSRTIQKVALSADGSRVCATGGKGPAIVWDSASGDIVCALPHDGAPACVRFFPDGRRAVSVDAQSNAVCVFELPG
jgi:WD40 repeat protein